MLQNTDETPINYTACCTLADLTHQPTIEAEKIKNAKRGEILNIIFNEDCLITMSRIESGTVDLILQDPPYGTTANDWDKLPDLNTMWKEWNRIIKPNGAIIMTASQPFTTDLIMSNRKDFRYCLVWDKMRSCGSMLCNVMPLKYHEDIVIFYKKKPTYNPQMERGQRLRKASGGNSDNYGSMKMKIVRKENDQYYPKSIISIKACHNMTGKFHPTEKPIDLMRYLIRTYSNENETVFDGYAGSGTTAHACILEKRNFICSELHEPYFKYAKQRIDNARMQTKLF